MSELLKEANWLKVIKEKKNLGLRMMGTGVSKKLSQCETMYGSFENELKAKGRDYEYLRVVADNYLHGLQGLMTHLESETKKHPLFTTAMDYLKKVLAEAKKREIEVKTQMKFAKEEWLKKGHEKEVLVKNAARLSEVKKLVVAVNVALIKAGRIQELTDKNLPYQKTLKELMAHKDLPGNLKNSIPILILGPGKDPKKDFVKVKEEMGKSLQNIIAALPK